MSDHKNLVLNAIAMFEEICQNEKYLTHQVEFCTQLTFEKMEK